MTNNATNTYRVTVIERVPAEYDVRAENARQAAQNWQDGEFHDRDDEDLENEGPCNVRERQPDGKWRKVPASEWQEAAAPAPAAPSGRFEIEHKPEEHPDRVHVRIDGKFDVAVIRTDEGVVVDVYPKGGSETIASTYAFDSEAEAPDGDVPKAAPPLPAVSRDEYAHATEIVPGVFLDPGAAIHIADRQGEIVSWNHDEIAADPSGFTAALAAVAIATKYGPSAVRENIETGGAVLARLTEATGHQS